MTKLTAEYPLINYVTQHWGWHLEEGPRTDMRDERLECCEEATRDTESLDLIAVALQPKLQELSIWDKATWEVLETNGSAQSAPISALHFLASFKFPETAKR